MNELINPNPCLIPLLHSVGFFEKHPFALMDIGCSGGILDVWRNFGHTLVCYGIDPQQAEIERLKAKEKLGGVKYYPYFIGIKDSISAAHRNAPSYFNPMPRSSAFSVNLDEHIQLKIQSNPVGVQLTDQWITIPEFVKREGIDKIDFVKIDTDGSDFEILLSFEGLIARKGILGFMVESNFQRGFKDTENNFANIDKFLKRNGLLLFNLSVVRYSRAALPARFSTDLIASTRTGQPMQCDVVYLRDAGAPDYLELWKEELSVEKILKLACLYEMFRVNDCAAETITKYADRIADVIDPSKLLDAITPEFQRIKYSYKDYIERFRASPSDFTSSADGTPPPPEVLMQENKALQERILSLLDSRSWKMMAPFRRLKDLITRIIG